MSGRSKVLLVLDDSVSSANTAFLNSCVQGLWLLSCGDLEI